MSLENVPPAKDDGRSSGSQKTPPEQGLRCPRCDSPNTKFCYYNNYNLSQPRHFCKTCRRYWTKGGALRSVPIGGGCRKNKKTRSSSSRLSGENNSNNSSGSTSELGGFKFFQGTSLAMDFQLGGISNFPKLYNPQFLSYSPTPCNTSPWFDSETLGSSLSSPPMGFNFHLPSVMKQGESSGYGLEGVEDQIGTSMNVHSNIASSIESLSSINQDLHWKLQQQRLGMLVGGGEYNQNENPSSSLPTQSTIVHRPQPFMFHNLEIARNATCGAGGSSRREGGGGGDIANEWLFETSYAPMINENPTNNGSNGTEGTTTWNGIQGWSDLNQYGALP